jgi:hypothetical protein
MDYTFEFCLDDYGSEEEMVKAVEKHLYDLWCLENLSLSGLTVKAKKIDDDFPE